MPDNGNIAWSREIFAEPASVSTPSYPVTVFWVNVQATSTAAASTVTFYKGKTTASSNKMAIVATEINGSGIVMYSFGHDSTGVYLEGGARAVTSSNVAFCSIGYRRQAVAL